ncbi:MAG: membrane or secreted protein [Cytophagaceae bacterium]|nr:membrane or secreted protein [Cytophagaceae bacterium]MBL0303274.1 membrane or secreted protein [Cytophagaceae bacterium]MBL0326125.1 membrane or secreted protein [Cytophagaceae bacterium]
MKKIIFLMLIIPAAFAQGISGAWRAEENDLKILLIASENYFTLTTYKTNEFLETWGGKYELSQTGEFLTDIEFHSSKPSLVNSVQTYNILHKKKSLELNDVKFEKVSEKDNALTGLWKITARANPEGEMNPMQAGPRKTLKIMGGGCFQWFAINTSTREFSGTGGGTYILKDKKYIEKIEFFSRDNARVGAELSFDADIADGKWQHSGKSSKGDPVREIWTKISF